MLPGVPALRPTTSAVYFCLNFSVYNIPMTYDHISFVLLNIPSSFFRKLKYFFYVINDFLEFFFIIIHYI